MPTRSVIINTLLLCIAVSFLSAPSLAGTLTSVVDRNRISLNETLSLTVSYDQQADTSSLDLSVLENDFEVLSSSPQSSNAVSVINGKTTQQASTVWTILLAAKKAGTLTIPSFSIDGDRSKAISIEVSEGAQAKTSTQPLQVWVSADRDTVYPTQQLIVEIEISAQANVADLNGPQLIVNGADVEPLGQQTFRRLDNGVARQIVVLKYAVFAKQAGELTIPVMTYTGIQGGRRSIFGSSGSQVVARSEQLTLTVSEPPKSTVAPFDSAPWFPAQSVTIESSWSGDKNSITAGEPITRTITIRARGQRPNVIPPLDRPSQSNAYKVYRDQPQLNSSIDTDGFVSTRTESEAIVVNAAGELTLPALELSWWNVAEQQWQLATLPAETIQVSAAVNAGDTSQTADASAAESFVSSPKLATQGAVSPVSTETPLGVWHWLTGILFIICGAQTWLLLRLNKLRGSSHEDESLSVSVESERDAWRQLKQAAARDDVSSLRQKLTLWVRAVFPDDHAVSIQTLVNRADNVELGQAIETLESVLYSTDTVSGPSYDSSKLLVLLTQLRPQLMQTKPTKGTIGTLPDLYPSS